MHGKPTQIRLLECVLFLPYPLMSSELVPQLAADASHGA